MRIALDDLRGPQVAALLQEHLDDMAEHSPADSCHALDLEGLRVPEVRFWCAWDGDALAGCGALKRLDDTHGEIKSMRTARSHLRQGIAARLLQTVVDDARAQGLRRLSLETGAPEAFAPARELYTRFGFLECAPFGDYREDPYSVFMTLEL